MLDSLNTTDIQEITSISNPSEKVKFTMEVVSVFVGEKLDWKEGSVKLLNQGDFLQQLAKYDKDNNIKVRQRQHSRKRSRR